MSPVSLKMDCQQSTSAVDCSFQFTNVADEDYYLLKRDTPLEGLHSPLVAVFRDGVPLQYEGCLLYRASPQKDEFILLKAGETVTATAQINNIFTFSSDGVYNIRYNKPLKVLLKDKMELQSDSEDMEGVDLMKVEVSESVDIQLENTDLLSHPIKEEEVKEGDEVYMESCDNVAKFVGGAAAVRAETTLAHNKLCEGLRRAGNNAHNNQKYRTWFGAFNLRRRNLVRNYYLKSFERIMDNCVTYDFTRRKICDKSNSMAAAPIFAYSCYRNNAIFMCKGYAGLPTFCSGRNARINKEGLLAGLWTVIVKNTNYDQLGVNECQTLARNDPDKAVKNLGNYGFYYCANA